MDSEEVIEALAEDVKNLKQEVATLETNLLQSHRIIALHLVMNSHNHAILQTANHAVGSQIIIATTKARTAIQTSDKPLDLARTHYRECFNIISNAGIQTINF